MSNESAVARFAIRRTLGQYEHEELEITLAIGIESDITAEQLMAKARKVCVENTTEALKKRRAEKAALEAASNTSNENKQVSEVKKVEVKNGKL